MRAVIGLLGFALLGAASTSSCGDDASGTSPQGGPGSAESAIRCGKGREVVGGHRVDVQRRCIAEYAPVGCRVPPDICDSALGYVRDAQGRIWQFPDLCLPEGMETLSSSEATPWGSTNLCDPSRGLP